MPVILCLPLSIQQAIWSHLLAGEDEQCESAAFAFAKHVEREAVHSFECVDWYAVPVEGFEIRSGYHIELTDEIRATVIKRAHDLNASVVEFHSHLGPWPAQFSPSDRMGLAEFVPHVRWRLRGRPYLAVVTTRTDFDGLAWVADSSGPVRLDGINLDDRLILPTGLSSLEYQDDN
jgi:hypothetical protein